MINCEDLKLSRTQEVWVQITDEVVPYIKPYYYVSNWGRIGSTASGSFQILSVVKDNDGYLNVCLHLYLNIIDEVGHVRRHINKRVNRLVMMSFYQLPENYESLEVNHINSIRDDNHLWNLEWTTSRENTLHALEFGFKEIQDISGSKNPMAKLTESDIFKMVELAKTGQYTYKDLGNMFNIADNTIKNILAGRAWSHLNLDITDEDLYNIHLNSRVKSTAFTDEEIESICKFYELADINNTLIYPNIIDIARDCFFTLGLDKKYNFESKKKTLIKILRKSVLWHSKITSKYDYDFIR